MTSCPCCRRPYPRDGLPLTDMERRVYEAVHGGNGLPVPTHRIIDYVYSDDPNGGPLTADGNIRVMVHRIRRKLGDVIVNEHGGYRLR